MSTTLPNTIETALANATSASFTLTLPLASTNKSKKFTVSRVDGTGNTVTVAVQSGDFIGGGSLTTTLLVGIEDTITLQSDGARWRWVSSNVRTTQFGFTGGSGGVTVNYNPNNLLNATPSRTQAGVYPATFTPGAYSGFTTCSCNAGGANGGFCGGGASNNGYTVYGFIGTTPTDGLSYYISCVGPR